MNDGKERSDVEAVVFDNTQNLQLAEIPVQDLFYLSQQTVSVFSVNNLKTKEVYIYKGVAGKWPNEVRTFLMNYIKNYIFPDIKELRVFSDNCPGQKKIHCVLRMCRALTEMGGFEKV